MRMVSCLIVVALFGGESVAMAQRVSGGVKGGVSFANFSHNSSQDEDLDWRTGITAGAFVTLPVAEPFSVQLEGLFTQKGAAFNQFGVTGTTKLDYFEVPVLFVFSTAPPRSGGTSIQVFGGPAVAFKISAKGTGSFEGETTNVDIPDEDIKSVDLGVAVGAGVAFGRLTIDGRYTIGLSNISTDESDSANVRNRSLAVLAGIRF